MRPYRPERCTVTNCSQQLLCRGCCERHYKQLRKLGAPDPSIPAPLMHGYYGTPTYGSWHSMLNRCTNVNEPAYGRYGGRGISVCERWRVFTNFLDDMGRRPTGLSLDRIDNDGNYEPGNCRWATAQQQALNRSPKTQCMEGHPFSEANTYIDKRGRRSCRICNARRAAAYRRANEVAAEGLVWR